MWARFLRSGLVWWWAGRESNPHSRRRLIYSQRSSPPAQPTHEGNGGRAMLRHRGDPGLPADSSLGADDGTRTRNLRFTKPLLYQLSYVGAHGHIPQQNLAPANDRAPRARGSSEAQAARPGAGGRARG